MKTKSPRSMGRGEGTCAPYGADPASLGTMEVTFTEIWG